MADTVDFDRTDRPSTAQPAPVPNDSVSVHAVAVRGLIREHGGPRTQELVTLVEERAAFGLRKYGTPLQAGNGRDPITDAIEELIDGIAYVTQAAIEDGDPGRVPMWTDVFCDVADVTERLLELREMIR